MKAATDTSAATQDLPLREALRYGALGAPLAFVALPLYVHWPAFASPSMGLSLAALGGMLLAMRVLDALIDPWLGHRVDALLLRPRRHVVRAMTAGAAVMAAGFAALFVLPSMLTLSAGGWVITSMAALAATYVAYSFVVIAHQAWGARLGGDDGYRAQVVGARELFALGGVLVASVLPSVAGWGVVSSVLVALLAVGLALLVSAPTGAPARAGVAGQADAVSASPQSSQPASSRQPSLAASSEQRMPLAWGALLAPLRHAEFRALLAVHALGGLASAIPATLVLFFIRDRLALQPYEGLFLLAYFAAAAVSVPLWTRLVEALGLVRVWACGMALAMAVFVFAAWLGPGDAVAFTVVCLGSGLALGAELVAPAALLAGVIRRGGPSMQGEGLWFGWWNLCSKLNLALAAGLALPLVQALGYRAGDRDGASVMALVVVYALVPCVIKAAAMTLLLTRRWSEPSRNDRGAVAEYSS